MILLMFMRKTYLSWTGIKEALGSIIFISGGLLSICFLIGVDANATDADGYIESQKILAKQEAAIRKAIEDENKEFRKFWITPRTLDPQLLAYYRGVANRIEKFGTLNFPQDNGQKIYGSGVVHILISKSGTIYEKGGGVLIEKSSGNTIVDQAMIRAVRKAAPFGRCPPKLPLTGLDPSPSDSVCALAFPFNFTREALTPLTDATNEKEISIIPAQN